MGRERESLGRARETGLGKVDQETALRARDRSPISTCPAEAKSSLYTQTSNYISETEFWVKQKRIVLLLCQAKGATAG